MSAHEDFSRQGELRGPSDRSFGWVIAVFLLVVGVWPIFHGHGVRGWALALGTAVGAVSAARPGLLGPANKIWMRFGQLLGSFVNPVVLAALFYGVITPVGWMKRRFGADALRLKPDPNAASYWIERRPPGPKPETMTQQF